MNTGVLFTTFFIFSMIITHKFTFSALISLLNYTASPPKKSVKNGISALDLYYKEELLTGLKVRDPFKHRPW